MKTLSNTITNDLLSEFIIIIFSICVYYYYGILIYFCSAAGVQLFLLPLALPWLNGG